METHAKLTGGVDKEEVVGGEHELRCVPSGAPRACLAPGPWPGPV